MPFTKIASAIARPFLAIAIDLFQVGDEKVEFNLHEFEKFPSFTNHVYPIDVFDHLTQEWSRMKQDSYPLKVCLIDSYFQEEKDLEIHKWPIF